MLSKSEEDYLKAIFTLSSNNDKIGTNSIAEFLSVAPASANNMLKKLSEKGYTNYKKYTPISLTSEGLKVAVQLIRKHRLWETFLYQKLNFTWDEVHEVAEQLEHVKSKKLTDRLDEFLGFPKSDPHGEPIPDNDGVIAKNKYIHLKDLEINVPAKIAIVKDESDSFLRYASKIGVELEKEITLIEKVEYDDTYLVDIDGKQISLSNKFADNIYVEVK